MKPHGVYPYRLAVSRSVNRMLVSYNTPYLTSFYNLPRKIGNAKRFLCSRTSLRLLSLCPHPSHTLMLSSISNSPHLGQCHVPSQCLLFTLISRYFPSDLFSISQLLVYGWTTIFKSGRRASVPHFIGQSHRPSPYSIRNVRLYGCCTIQL